MSNSNYLQGSDFEVFAISSEDSNSVEEITPVRRRMRLLPPRIPSPPASTSEPSNYVQGPYFDVFSQSSDDSNSVEKITPVRRRMRLLPWRSPSEPYSPPDLLAPTVPSESSAQSSPANRIVLPSQIDINKYYLLRTLMGEHYISNMNINELIEFYLSLTENDWERIFIFARIAENIDTISDVRHVLLQRETDQHMSACCKLL